MKRFPAKKPSSIYTYAASFRDYLVAGNAIQSYTVEIAPYDKSDIPDASTNGMINGLPEINSATVEIDGEEHPAGTAILQSIAAGAEGADYVVSFKPIFTDGQRPTEDVILPVRKYEPTTS